MPGCSVLSVLKSIPGNQHRPETPQRLRSPDDGRSGRLPHPRSCFSPPPFSRRPAFRSSSGAADAVPSGSSSRGHCHGQRSGVLLSFFCREGSRSSCAQACFLWNGSRAELQGPHPQVHSRRLRLRLSMGSRNASLPRRLRNCMGAEPCGLLQSGTHSVCEETCRKVSRIRGIMPSYQNPQFFPDWFRISIDYIQISIYNLGMLQVLRAENLRIRCGIFRRSPV